MKLLSQSRLAQFRSRKLMTAVFTCILPCYGCAGPFWLTLWTRCTITPRSEKHAQIARDEWSHAQELLDEQGNYKHSVLQ
jgi:hypothetical protein